MEIKRIGFIGFGEVGRAFSKEMKTQGAEVYYYDIVNKKPEKWITFLPLNELIQTCDIILSTVVSHVAIEVAQEAAKFLNFEKTYSDMNSTSPTVKKKIARIIEESNANFIEGAVLSAVGETGSKASILVSGKKAEEFSRWMNRLGLINLKYFSPQIGDSSMVKMIRSIFSKGVECLLLEMLIAGRRAGIEDYLWKDIVDLMRENSFERVAENWIKTHPLACERRYHEVVQAIETLEEIGIDPVMTRSTLNFFQRSMIMGLRKKFETKPENFWSVPNFIEEKLREVRGEFPEFQKTL
ncbi:MAG: NAD(P)-binding domain-containing protein [Thermodesulfobacteriota bacterium]|nr:NAD(P)-binding domain-containing protein [Thermodesulfobacteriota bacterium]